MSTPPPSLRHQVIRVYKGELAIVSREDNSAKGRMLKQTLLEQELLYMGREYPLGYDYFKPRLHKAFAAKAGLTDENEIRKSIKQAEFVKREIEALYFLKKYRAVSQAYKKDSC